MEQSFKKVVEHIFNNWSALQLAVEHSMGGPNSRQIAVDSVDYLVNYLTSESGIEVEDVEDVLEDIMDQEFNTVCEDDSIKEVSQIMCKFLNLIKEGKMNEVEVEYNKLPVGSQWLVSSQCIEQPEDVEEVGESSQSQDVTAETTMDEPMEEDPGWTTIKTRRKR